MRLAGDKSPARVNSPSKNSPQEMLHFAQHLLMAGEDLAGGKI